jgi:chorismate mutase
MGSLGEVPKGVMPPLDPAEYETAVAALREVINVEDLEIVRALNRRTAAAMEIGRLKAEYGEPVYVPGREEEVLDRVSAANDSEIVPDASAREFFSGGVIRISREAQHRVQETDQRTA